jgi:hypothetical protein
MAVIASVSGLNVAQPELKVEFDASQTEVLWFINLYTITLAALLLPLAAVGDRRGCRPSWWTWRAGGGCSSSGRPCRRRHRHGAALRLELE